MKRIIIVISLIGLLYSCGSSNSNKDDKLFSFSSRDSETFNIEAMQQIFKGFKLLNLKNNIAPLLKIKKIYFDAEQLYIVEPIGKLYVYNKATGEQQFIIDRKGQGPEDYLNINDVILQDNEIHIYCKIGQKIVKFKKSNGAFIGAEKIDIYASNGVIKYNNSIFFGFNLGKYLITKTDTNYNIQEKFIKRVFYHTTLNLNTLFKSNKGLFYVFPMSDSLYHYSDNKFQLYKVIRRTNGIDNTAGERELKKEFPYYTGGFIYDCFITNTIEFVRIMPHSCIYLKKNNTITTYKYPVEYLPFINRVPGFTRSIDNNHLYMFENDAFGIKEDITKNIDTYKKLSEDKNCPYADFYKTLLEKLSEINEDTPPLVFIAEINE